MVPVELPVAAAGELLLVPREWARPSLLLNADRFYETSVLSRVQLERAARTVQCHLLTHRKEDLKAQEDLARRRRTSLEEAQALCELQVQDWAASQSLQGVRVSRSG